MPEGSDHLSDVMQQFGLPWVDQYPTYDDEEHWGSAGGCHGWSLDPDLTPKKQSSGVGRR